MRPNWFVGLPVPAGPWFDAVLADLPEQCRGFSGVDLHMTVAFLGPVSAEVAQRVVPVMGQIRGESFEVRLGGLLALPKPKRFSALSFELVEGRGLVSDLISRWRDRLIDAVDSRRDERPPLPHVTVARPIRRFGTDGRRVALAWARNVVPPDVALTIDRVALYTWSDTRPEPQFKIVHQVGLASGAG